MTATEQALETARVAVAAAADKKAHDIVVLDVSEQLVITDCFVIASAPNERQVEAIVDAVEEKLRERGVKPVRREGAREGEVRVRRAVASAQLDPIRIRNANVVRTVVTAVRRLAG